MTAENSPRYSAPGQSTTVVVPLYNSSKTIVRAIESVLAQTYPPERVIVVDDCSTDDGPDLVRSMKATTVEVIAMPANSGPSPARNQGVRQASTEWIAFLDADDTWEPAFLERVHAAATATGADFVSSGGVRERRPPHKPVLRLLDEPHEASERSADFWRIAWRFVPCHPSSTIVRRSLFNSVGGFPEIRPDGDWALWTRLWLGGTFAFVNQPLFTYAATEGSLSAYGRTYRQELKTAALQTRLLASAIRQHRPGTGWFALWYLRMLVRRQWLWASRRIERIRRSRSR